MHNALVGAGLRDHVKVGASGKIATGTDLVKRLVQGADYGNAARAMMFAVGCIQAQRCHTNTCPTGVTTQDPAARPRPRRRRQDRRASSASRRRPWPAPCRSWRRMGVTDPAQLRPHMLRRRIDPYTERSYAELYEWLEPGQLLAEPPASWAADWKAADPDRFTV